MSNSQLILSVDLMITVLDYWWRSDLERRVNIVEWMVDRVDCGVAIPNYQRSNSGSGITINSKV
jgi:hypothetical protein